MNLKCDIVTFCDLLLRAVNASTRPRPVCTYYLQFIISSPRLCNMTHVSSLLIRRTSLCIASAVDKSLSVSLSDAREAMINAVVDMLSSYRSSLHSGGQTAGQLMSPFQLRLVPLYILAMLKSVYFPLCLLLRDCAYLLCLLCLIHEPQSVVMRFLVTYLPYYNGFFNFLPVLFGRFQLILLACFEGFNEDIRKAWIVIMSSAVNGSLLYKSRSRNSVDN